MFFLDSDCESLDDDDGDDENVDEPSCAYSIAMAPSMDHPFTEPENSRNVINEFEIPILSTPIPPSRTRGGLNSNSLFHQQLISPIVNDTHHTDQSQLLPPPSQSTLPASPPRSISPPPVTTTPSRFLSPLSATPSLSPSPLNVPLTQLQSPVPSHYSADANEFIWNDNERATREFHFSGTPGVKNITDNPDCPLSILKTFLTDELIDNIVVFTNVYAEIMKLAPHIIEKLNNTQRSIFKLWKDVDRDDVWVYICIIILMGIIQKPYYHMYWTKLMRRDRFEQIRSFHNYIPG